jgi:flagellar basal-body rod protein FlgB
VSTIKLLENAINYCSTKNNVISKNIANIGTENYQREDVVFKDVFSEQLNKNLKATNSRHISSNPDNLKDQEGVEVVMDPNQDMASGVNNVDIEKEMADLAENTVMYKFSARKIGDYYKNLQKVIKGTPQ